MKSFFSSLLASILGFFISLFLLFVFFFIIIAVIASGAKKEVSVSLNSILTLTLDQQLPERPTDNPLGKFAGIINDMKVPVSLKTIVDNIHRAKDDDKIKGIYLDLSVVMAGLSSVEEIRNALIDFKKSGKFIYAYSEVYTQKAYYLSSVADSIFLNKQGLFSFAGFNSEQMFLKGTLDKLEIEMKLIRGTNCKYKSAGETFTKTEMSDPNREQITSFIGSVYDNFLQNIADSRKKTAAELKDIADNLRIQFPSDAVKYGLVDKLAYKDEVLASLRSRLKIDKKATINCVTMADYATTPDKGFKYSANKIAIIYAVGDIMGGNGSETQIGSEKLSEAIRKARLDDNVKAIVLRINSPGGSALASDVIWREVLMAKKVKPVIASMGDVAASGGYYIAAPCDSIVSEPNTVTGSIGVFGLIPQMKKFWNDKLGVTWDRVNTGKYSDLGNPNREMTPEEEQIIQRQIDTIYIDFKMRVSQGRRLKPEFVDSIAEGRVYSGIQAKKIGLVDRFGSLDDAIALAAKMAKIDKYNTEILPQFGTSFSKIFSAVAQTKEGFLQEELGPNYSTVKKLENVQNLQGVLMYYPGEMEIN